MKAKCQEKVVLFVKAHSSKPLDGLYLNNVQHEHDITQASLNTITVLKLRCMR